MLQSGELDPCLDWPIPNPTVSSSQNGAPAIPTGSMSSWWVQERRQQRCSRRRETVHRPRKGAHAGPAHTQHRLCNAVSLKVNNDTTFTDPLGVAFVSPKVVFEADVKVTPLAAIYKHGTGCGAIGGLQLYASRASARPWT